MSQFQSSRSHIWNDSAASKLQSFSSISIWSMLHLPSNVHWPEWNLISACRSQLALTQTFSYTVKGQVSVDRGALSDCVNPSLHSPWREEATMTFPSLLFHVTSSGILGPSADLKLCSHESAPPTYRGRKVAALALDYAPSWRDMVRK